MLNNYKQSIRIIIISISLLLSYRLAFTGINTGKVEYAKDQGHNLAWSRYPVEGFAWPASVKPGETIKFYVSVMDTFGGQNYDVAIFRIPDETSSVWDSANLPGHFYPLRGADLEPIYPGDFSRKPIDYKLGCKNYWSPTAITKTIGSGWQSGLYFARFNHHSTNDYFYAPFVVRAANPGVATSILFKFDFNTFIAYSHFGGGSLYSDKDTLSLTYTDSIATDRPIEQSTGEYKLTWNDYKSNYVTFIKTLDSLGYSMEYCNNIDIDSIPSASNDYVGMNLLSQYKMLVISWHDEYWSLDERINIEKFKGTNLDGSPSGLHGNIARFAPNTCYWQIHWDMLSGGVKNYLKLGCRKSNWPGHHPVDLWRDTDYGPGLPEAKLLGEQFDDSFTDVLTPPDTVRKADHWIFKGTGLQNDSAFGYGFLEGHYDSLVDSIVYERKGIVFGELEDTTTTNGKADFPITLLSGSRVAGIKDLTATTVLKQMVYYEDTSSNARIFAEGANGWPCGLSPNADHSTDRERMKKITDNIFSHFSWKKFAGKVYTSSQFPVTWNTPIEIDADANILSGKYLAVTSTNVTIDSNVGMYVNGSMEVNGSVYVGGNGTMYINPTGKIILKPNAVLTMDTPLFLEAGGDVQFGGGAKLILNGITITSTETLTLTMAILK